MLSTSISDRIAVVHRWKSSDGINLWENSANFKLVGRLGSGMHYHAVHGETELPRATTPDCDDGLPRRLKDVQCRYILYCLA